MRVPPTPEERAAELAELERLATRDRWRDLCIAALEGALALGTGLYLLGWSMHTTVADHGEIAFFSGLLIGNTGLLLALVRAHARATARGDV